MIKVDNIWGDNEHFDVPSLSILEPAPANAAIATLEEVKLQVRCDSDEEDALLRRALRAATVHVEKFCGISILPRKVRLDLTRFPGGTGEIKVPIRPVRLVQSITYISPIDGTRKTIPVTDYRLVSTRFVSEIVPAYNVWWPVVRYDRLGIEITMDVGYEAGADGIVALPDDMEDLRSAVLLMVGDLYENRESQGVSTRIYSSMFDNKTFRRLLAHYRVRIV